MQACQDPARHCLQYTRSKKKKKFKEKEKCGETAVSVTNGYGRFSVYMFL